MAKLTTEERKKLPKSDFAVPSKAPGPGSYPIPDKSHAKNAEARASGKSVAGKVDAKVERKYPNIRTDSKGFVHKVNHRNDCEK